MYSKEEAKHSCDKSAPTETYKPTLSNCELSLETLIWVLNKLYIVKRKNKNRAQHISFVSDEAKLEDTIWCQVHVISQLHTSV